MNKNLNTAPDWSLEDSMQWVVEHLEILLLMLQGYFMKYLKKRNLKTSTS
jgi:hypothetical protein